MRVNKRIAKPKEPRLYLRLNKVFIYIRLLIVTSVAVSVIGVIGFYGVRVTQQLLGRPIVAVVVQGDFKYVERERIEVLVQDMIGGSFVGENINRIRANLKIMPWIDSVNLVRQWPDRLLVNITEHVPIARWGDAGFVNVRGELILTKDHSGLMHLSKLSGERDEAQMIMRQYSVLANVFQTYELSITSLTKDRRGMWQLSLNNGWQVILGRGEVFKKIQRLTHLLDLRLLSVLEDVKLVDIRYPNGLSIQWGSSNTRQEALDSAVVSKKISSKVKLRHMQDAMYARG
ncbi:MAG: cell division protein FtsQ [Kiritimatiellia bacterium]|jgi:cell division protein FtsQ